MATLPFFETTAGIRACNATHVRFRPWIEKTCAIVVPLVTSQVEEWARNFQDDATQSGMSEGELL